MNETVWDFLKIYTDFRPRILGYLTRLVGEFEAEDLTQEVFIRISNALHNFRGESQLQTWIYRVATNAAIDRLRQTSYQRAPLALQDKIDEEEIGVADRVEWGIEPEPSPEQQVFLQQGLDCYCGFIENLPNNYRLIVALNQLGELTTKEIAEMLGLSQDTVKIRLHRGKARLLQELKAHCKAEDWL